MDVPATGDRRSRRLSELRGEDEARFGGKSARLGELLRAGIPVPAGFALPTEAFSEFMLQSGLRDRLTGMLAAVTPDLDSVGAASHAISEMMRSVSVPESVRQDLSQGYRELGELAGTASPPVAVRSSALGEDGQEATFAGQQETYLWVRGIEHVLDAVRDCWLSLYSAPAISYRSRLGLAQEDAAMGVAIQLMVDAEVSGVMFTCNPVSGDPSMVAINASWGLGLAVVGGEVTPDDYLLSKVTREVVREHVTSKRVEYVPDAGGRGAVRRQVPQERRDSRCLDRAALDALADVARRIERYFGSHQDIEWGLARGSSPPGSLFVLQSRPVTALPKQDPRPPPASALELVMGTFGADRKPSER